MPAEYAFLVKMKTFVKFTDDDVDNLKALRPLFVEKGPGITDSFYETLGQFEDTQAFIEGRVDALKKTHGAWMLELFDGEYNEAYFDRRVIIGDVHVKIGLPPQYVEGVMTHLRSQGTAAIFERYGDTEEAKAKADSLRKILDLDLMTINLAYSEERLDRVSRFTGMSRKLIENVIKRAKKK